MSYTQLRKTERTLWISALVLVAVLFIQSGAMANHKNDLIPGTPTLQGDETDVINRAWGYVITDTGEDWLRAKLWRVIPAWPDTFLGQANDKFPGNLADGHYFAISYICAYPDAERNYMTEAEFDTWVYNPPDEDSSVAKLTCTGD